MLLRVIKSYSCSSSNAGHALYAESSVAVQMQGTLCIIAIQSLICSLHRNGFILGVVKSCFAFLVKPKT